MLFTSLTAEREFHDAHIASLEQACETPGGFSRQHLATLSNFAQAKLDWNAANPVPRDGAEWAATLRIENRQREDLRLRAIVAECKILLTGTPCEFEESAIELDHWLSEDPTDLNGRAAREAGRAAA